MFKISDVRAGYGDSTVLHGVDLSLADSEVAALLGPNGAGKTTLLRTASGFVRPRSGLVDLDGVNLTQRPAFSYVRQGVCHLPEGRGIFPSLTVRENLVIQGRRRKAKDAILEAVDLFPALATRLGQTAGSLSGGEQQMLSLCRAYITKPKVVLIDEPSLGLAPKIIDTIYAVLASFAANGMSLIIVEQYVQRALELADKVYILSRGVVVHDGKSHDITADEIYERYLGIDA